MTYRKSLSRAQREAILAYCLKGLSPVMRRRAPLVKPGGFEDLVDEVGIHIWIALLRYRRKPYDEALKLAYRSGQNRLASIVRSVLTSRRRGATLKFVSLDSVAPTLYQSEDMTSCAALEFIEIMVTLAVRIVGPDKATHLVQATLHDWSRRTRTTENHRRIMDNLGLQRRDVVESIMRLREALRKALVAETKPLTVRTPEGVWKAALQG